MPKEKKACQTMQEEKVIKTEDPLPWVIEYGSYVPTRLKRGQVNPATGSIPRDGWHHQNMKPLHPCGKRVPRLKPFLQMDIWMNKGRTICCTGSPKLPAPGELFVKLDSNR